MKAVRLFVALAGVFVLAACASLTGQRDIDAINAVRPTGSPFTQQLTEEYRNFANFEWRQMGDYRDGQYFAQKGLRTARGEVVPPEELGRWKLPPAMTGELSSARARLMTQLDGGARERAPMDAAIAQARFDCWVEQQEENWQVEDIAACRQEFLAALARLEGARAPAAAPAAYMVFFDFDRATVTPAGQRVINDVLAEARRVGASQITVIGHTDTSGSPAYNQHLSERRAAAVRQALVRAGIPTDRITTTGRGETQPMVATGDGVREPSNRRAEIGFR